MEKPVVRFAPSPTGPLHMGGVRTALYNYLFAKQQGGTLILRIEDTDQTRFVAGAEAYIIDALNWCGITFDEGPHLGGKRGPYRQSERSELYQKYAKILLEKGQAYYAFDTAEELEAMRERLEAEGASSRTYNHETREQMTNSLTLSAEEVQARLDRGDDYVLRIKIPKDQEVKLYDEVRKEVIVNSSEIDDKVLMKSDGLPTYHLANIIDDHLMGITHVIRGEEWLPSTPLHVMLYRAFGWEDSMPKWIHLPLLLKPDPSAFMKSKAIRREMTDKLTDEFMSKFADEVGADKKSKIHSFVQNTLSDQQGFSKKLKEDEKDPGFMKLIKDFLHGAFFGKLSKRDGDRLGFPVFPTDWIDPKTGARSPGYREEGYLPHAFMNALALLGWNPGNDEEIMSMDRLIALFSFDRISHSGARFDQDKMKWFNKTYLQHSSNEALLPLVKAELEKANIETNDEELLLQVIGLLKERVTFLPDFAEMAGMFFSDPADFDENMVQKRWKPESKAYLQDLYARWDALPAWKEQPLHDEFEALIADRELNNGQVLAPLRLALTGIPNGPGVFEIAEVIGKTASLRRIATAVGKLG